MSTIFDLAQINTTEYAYINRIDRDILYSAVNDYVSIRMEASREAQQFFVEDMTTSGRLRYQLPMNGYDEPIRSTDDPPNLRRQGSWEVGFPIYTYRPSIARTPVGIAYMPPQEFQTYIDGIITRYDETKRREILRAIFDDSQDTFNDPEEILSNETVEPLANGDSVKYPAILGANSEATENHYLVSGYTSANISDTNNPYETIYNDLIHHFTRRTGGSDIVALINPDEQAKTEALSGFVPVRDTRVSLNDTEAELNSRPDIPGETIGRVSGVTVAIWDWIPSGYIFARHMAATAPLLMRVDQPGTGLGGGNLINMEVTEQRAINYRDWMYRFGMGAGNRLNGVVMELTTDGTYTAPTI